MRDREMLDYMPKEYGELLESSEVIRVEADELDKLNFVIGDILRQFFIETATWGIAYWESLVEITSEASDDYEIRRARVKAKWLTKPPMTVKKLEMVASSFLNRPVKITEINEEYAFTLDFAMPAVEYHKVYEFRAGMTPIRVYDKLLSFRGMVEAVEYAKPAHLRAIYAPKSRDMIQIRGKATVKTYEYHRVYEFRAGMTPIKYISEAVL